MAERQELQDPDGWQYYHAEQLTGGLNLGIRPDKLKDDELLECQNVTFELDRVRIDTGYVPFFGKVTGTPRAVVQYHKKNGQSELLLITNSALYTLRQDQWQYVRWSTEFTTLTAQANEGATSLSVVSSASFQVGSVIGIVLTDGKQHQTTVATVPNGTSITINDPIPIGKTAANGAEVLLATTFGGDDDIAVSTVTLPFNDWFVFTNGVNAPIRYNGTDAVYIPNLPGGTNFTCRVVQLYQNYLLLINTVESGTAFPQRVRWCDTADPTNWTTGNAGFRDLYSSEDFCIAAAPLGPYMAIYKERSIVRMEYVGSVEKLFHFEDIVSGEGTFSQDAIVDLGDYHIFVGNANIYKYTGGYSIDPVGDKVFDRLFGARGELNPEFKHRSFAFYVEELDEVWIFFPAGTSQKPNKMLRWRQEVDSWADRIFDRDFVGYGFYLAQVSRPWSGLVGSWLNQTWKWNAVSVLSNSPTTLLCDATDQVFVYDYVEPRDNGQPIRYAIQTKDITHPRFKFRTDSIRFRAKGSNILLEYSSDGGQSWESLGLSNTSGGASYQETEIFFQDIIDRIRFRWSGTGGGMAFEWYTLKYALESEF